MLFTQVLAEPGPELLDLASFPNMVQIGAIITILALVALAFLASMQRGVKDLRKEVADVLGHMPIGGGQGISGPPAGVQAPAAPAGPAAGVQGSPAEAPAPAPVPPSAPMSGGQAPPFAAVIAEPDTTFGGPVAQAPLALAQAQPMPQAPAPSQAQPPMPPQGQPPVPPEAVQPAPQAPPEPLSQPEPRVPERVSASELPQRVSVAPAPPGEPAAPPQPGPTPEAAAPPPARSPAMPVPDAPPPRAAQPGVEAAVPQAINTAARREISLVGRSLKILDELEQSETDPDKLFALFALDNLMARMRRGAETQMILAGRDPERAIRDSLSVSDVIRTASSQIEHYERIRITPDWDPMIRSYAVVPLSHLFAELLENATEFSPEGTAVEVGATNHRGDVVVTITDSGVGMTPQELAAVNKIAAEGPEAEDLAHGRLGVAVVARLAARLGVAVSFAPGQGEDGAGSTALVRVPSRLVDDRPEPAEPVTGSGLVMPPRPELEPSAVGPAPATTDVFQPVRMDSRGAAGLPKRGDLPRRQDRAAEAAAGTAAPAATPTPAPEPGPRAAAAPLPTRASHRQASAPVGPIPAAATPAAAPRRTGGIVPLGARFSPLGEGANPSAALPRHAGDGQMLQEGAAEAPRGGARGSAAPGPGTQFPFAGAPAAPVQPAGSSAGPRAQAPAPVGGLPAFSEALATGEQPASPPVTRRPASAKRTAGAPGSEGFPPVPGSPGSLPATMTSPPGLIPPSGGGRHATPGGAQRPLGTPMTPLPSAPAAAAAPGQPAGVPAQPAGVQAQPTGVQAQAPAPPRGQPPPGGIAPPAGAAGGAQGIAVPPPAGAVPQAGMVPPPAGAAPQAGMVPPPAGAAPQGAVPPPGGMVPPPAGAAGPASGISVPPPAGALPRRGPAIPATGGVQQLPTAAMTGSQFAPAGTLQPGGGGNSPLAIPDLSGSIAGSAIALKASIQEEALAELAGLNTYKPERTESRPASSLARRQTGASSVPAVAAPSSTPPKARDADKIRSALSAFQIGTKRGRSGSRTPAGKG
ncbi:MAG: hypothetical protein LBL01_03575 [Bifidobacteriaceae bacterium]|jgi:hypothetical protein|nr:hypothetical protein [Bifidobacteriaceae bacterium]